MWTEAQYVAASERADDLQGRGRRDEAEAVLGEALEQARAAGDEGFVAFLEGSLAWLEHDYEGMLERLQRANELRPNFHVILRDIGAALGLLGREQEAIEWFDRALALRADDQDALQGRGVCLAGMGRYHEALEWFDRALAVRPDDYSSLSSRGVALMYLDRHREALEWFDKALAIAPDYVHSIRSKAVVLGLMGKDREAVEILRQRLEKDPADEDAKTWLARFAPPKEAQAPIKELQETRRRREQERLGAEREARERKIKLEAWRSLSARSAHRIGNQLFASRGALRTLRELELPEAAEPASDLEASLDRIRRIVQEFQTFSRNEEPRLLATPIGPVVNDVVRRYQGLAENIELSADIVEKLPTCLLDRDQIDQVLGELLENAIYHTASGGRIRVTAQSVQRGSHQVVRITVADSGPGLSDKDKESVFGPFVTTKPGGSGLGLAIVRQIVENHRGTIRETGKEGVGAQFEIDLPAVPNEESES